jgi:hypothetical protein
MAYERPSAPRGNRAPAGAPAADGNTSGGGRSTPTPKMLDFAKSVAEQLGVDLPAEAETSFEACRDFLDAHPLPPTQKQLDFANKLAEERHIEVPEEALADKRKLSAWIDEILQGAK